MEGKIGLSVVKLSVLSHDGKGSKDFDRAQLRIKQDYRFCSMGNL